MILLLPSTSFCGHRRTITTLFMFFYSLLYFFIIQYGLTSDTSLELPLFLGASILILYLTMVDKYINQKIDLSEFLKIVLFIIIPTLLCFFFQTDNNQIRLVDIVVLALILAMTDSGSINKVPMLYRENTIEFYGLSTTSNLLILFIFLGYRRIDIDLFWINTIDVWVLTLLASFLCCFFTFLIGFKLKYISFNNTEKVGLKKLIILIIFNFFHVAIAEEIVYRGIIYNYLRQLVGGGDWIPLILSTLFFGYQHIAYAGKRMFVLATIAGFFYCLIYILTQNLLTAVIVHTITNIIWRSFFILTSDLDSIDKSNLEVPKS